jgi:acyl carrier protein
MSTSLERDTVRQFIVTNFYVPDEGTLADDTSLLDQGIVDSTGVLELTSFIEEKFSIKVEDAEIVPENLDSIGSILAFIARKRT